MYDDVWACLMQEKKISYQELDSKQQITISTLPAIPAK